MKGVIYCYHCIPTGKKYIGQTLFETKRKAYHLCKSKDGNTKFYRAVRKYGWDNFIYGIIDELDNQFLNEVEMFYIKKYDTFKKGYNSTLGGDGTHGRVISEEEKEKSRIRMINNNPSKNEDNRKKRSEKMKGKKMPEDVVKRRNETRRKNNPEWHSKEMREKMSLVMKTKVGDKNHRYGKKHSDETKKKISNSIKNNKNNLGKKWWNNGQVNKMSVECPGNEWISGRCPKK